MSLPTFSFPPVHHSAEVEKVLYGLNVHMPSSSFQLSVWVGSELSLHALALYIGSTMEEWA